MKTRWLTALALPALAIANGSTLASVTGGSWHEDRTGEANYVVIVTAPRPAGYSAPPTTSGRSNDVGERNEQNLAAGVADLADSLDRNADFALEKALEGIESYLGRD